MSGAVAFVPQMMATIEPRSGKENAALAGALVRVVKVRRSAAFVVFVIPRGSYARGDQASVRVEDLAPSVGVLHLWRGNKLDGYWALPFSDVAARFVASRWAGLVRDGVPLMRALRGFLTDSTDGLDSVFEESQYDEVHEVVRAAVFPGDPS